MSSSDSLTGQIDRQVGEGLEKKKGPGAMRRGPQASVSLLGLRQVVPAATRGDEAETDEAREQSLANGGMFLRVHGGSR